MMKLALYKNLGRVRICGL